jgi:hypothetical protein
MTTISASSSSNEDAWVYSKKKMIGNQLACEKLDFPKINKAKLEVWIPHH